ncbi:MAG: FAD-binding protein [Alphaproteobacteria bacterium]|nr:FAD-binding protein [Alphaproteobacteria bacterium]
MPRDIEKIVRRAWRKPEDQARQDELAEAWERDPDAVEAAFAALDDQTLRRSKRPKPPRVGWDPRGQQRARWENPIGTRQIEPLLLFHPESTGQVAHVLAKAAAAKRRVRAVGNGHSATDCMVCDDYLIATSGLDRVLDLDVGVLRAGVDTRDLVRVQAGIRVAELNEALSERGKCMPNNTAFDGQSLAGLFATGSHGTGLGQGAVADTAVSLTVVGEGGRILRIEPADGITDARRFAAKHPEQVLIQEDAAFSAHLVAMGCLGVVTEIVLEVLDDYFLEEVRLLMEWEDAKALLTPAFLRENRHVAVLLNPYVVDDRRTGIRGRTAMVALRNPSPGPAAKHSRYGALVELANLVPKLPSRIMKGNPDRTPELLNQALRTLGSREGRRWTGRGCEVLNFGGTQRNSAYALNVGVDIDVCFEAIDAVVAELEARAAEGRQLATAPISLRWTGPSRAFMAPMYGRATCMIEPPCLHPTVGGFEILHALQRLLYRFGGRPHWGLEFNLTGAGGRVRELWGAEAYDAWLAQYRRFNANGTFDSVFTERVGFS